MAGQGPMPTQKNIPAILEVRRKRLDADNVNPANVNASLTRLPAPLGDPLRGAPNHVYVPGTFTDNVVQFRKNALRPMETPGDLAYQLQRFFNDIRAKYIPADPLAMENARIALVTQQNIVDDAGSSGAEINAAQALLMPI